MKLDSIGKLLGARELSASEDEVVKILIGVPEQIQGEDEYICTYQILGAIDSGVRYAIGADSIQALQLALKKIGADLYTSNEAKMGQLLWNGGRDLGFPVPDTLADLLP